MAKTKTLTQDILLRVRAPMLPASNGLRQSEQLLRSISQQMVTINQQMGRMASGMGAHSAKSLSELFRIQSKKVAPDMTPAQLGKIVGLTPQSVDRWMSTLKTEFGRKWSTLFSGGGFRSFPAAGKFFAEVFKREEKYIDQFWKSVASGRGPAIRTAPTGIGSDRITLRGGQVQATLSTPPLITLHVPASAITATLVGGNIPLQVLGAGGTGVGGSTAGGGSHAATPSVPGLPGETRRVIRTSAKGDVSVTVEQALAPFRTLATTYAGDKESTVETVRSAARLRQQINTALTAERHLLKQARVLHKSNPEALAAAHAQSARQIATLASGMQGPLASSGLGHVHADLMGRADVLTAQGAALRDQHQAALRQAQAKRDRARLARHAREQQELYDRQQRTLQDAQSAGMDDVERRSSLRTELAQARERGVRDWNREQDRRDRLRSRQQRVFDRAMKEAVPPTLSGATTKEVTGGGAPSQAVPTWRRKMFGSSGVPTMGNLFAQMIANQVSVGMWSLASFPMTAAIGGGFAAAHHTGTAVMETSLQTARLSQVFRGVGGDARELTNDILQLGAAEGRSRKEAMESAIQWSRLGMTRREVGEAVRVSLLAANVAELDAFEATEKLQSVMVAYGLQVRELSGVLGTLNSISNTYNVTNAAMLEGMTRSAAIAKQAGVGWADLAGMIGGTVGYTGQSGANIGNAIKSMLVSLSNPEIQTHLSERYGLSAFGAGGQIKGGGQRLRELWQLYRGLGPEERQNILFRVAGKTQASRMAAVMDNYITSQSLSIRGQRDLGSAERENAKITSELQYRWQGLVTQADAMLNAFNRVTGATDKLGLGLASTASYIPLWTAYVSPGLKMVSNTPIGNAAMFGLNWLADHGAGRDMQRQMGFQRELEQSRANLTTARHAQELYAAVTPHAGRLSTSEVEVLAGLMGEDLGGQLRSAAERKDTPGMQQLLARAAAVEAGNEKTATTEQQASFARELNRLKAERAQARVSRDDKRVAELDLQMRNISQRGMSFAEELLESEGVEAVTQERVSAKASLRYRLQGAEHLREGLGSTASGRLTDDLTMLRRQERMLLDEQTRIPAHDQARQKDATELLRDVRGQIAARLTGGPMAAEQDRHMVARELVKSELDMASVGRDQLEQLSRRARKYEEMTSRNAELLRLATTHEDKEKALANGAALRAEREHLILESVRARAGVAREEYEAQRRLLSLGPAELLSRVAARRMAARGVTPGSMLALSPALREQVQEEVDGNRRRRFLGQRPELGEMMRDLGITNDPLANLRTMAGTSASALFGVGEAASGATAALVGLKEQLENLLSRAPQPQPTPAGGPPDVPQAPTRGGRWHVGGLLAY